MAMLIGSDKLKPTSFQAITMRAKHTALFFLYLLLIAVDSSLASEARSPAPVSDATPQASTATPAPSQPSTLKASQPPALDDAALTAPGLGRAFEAFQPSEAISADNAVPFPTNI
jgi:hypothetical protein